MRTHHSSHADHAAVIASMHSTYYSTGEAHLDHDSGLVVDPGILPGGRWVYVYYDRDPHDDGDDWELDLARAVEVEEG